jgi:hypothetical protein
MPGAVPGSESVCWCAEAAVTRNPLRGTDTELDACEPSMRVCSQQSQFYVQLSARHMTLETHVR